MQVKDLKKGARSATVFLKSLANENRLLVLCQLVEGGKTVSELLEGATISQPAMSQHLRKMEEDGIVEAEQIGTQRFYTVQHSAVQEILMVLHKNFCEKK